MEKTYTAYRYRESDINSPNYELVIRTQEEFDSLYFYHRTDINSYPNWKNAKRVILDGDFNVKASIVIPNSVKEFYGINNTTLNIDPSILTLESLGEYAASIIRHQNSYIGPIEDGQELSSIPVDFVKFGNFNLNISASQSAASESIPVFLYGIGNISNINVKNSCQKLNPIAFALYCKNIYDINFDIDNPNNNDEILELYGCFASCYNIANINIVSKWRTVLFSDCINIINVHIFNEFSFVSSSIFPAEFFMRCQNLDNIDIVLDLKPNTNTSRSYKFSGIINSCNNVNNLMIKLNNIENNSKINDSDDASVMIYSSNNINNFQVSTSNSNNISSDSIRPLICFSESNAINNAKFLTDNNRYAKGKLYGFVNCGNISNYIIPKGSAHDDIITFSGTNINVVLVSDIDN